MRKLNTKDVLAFMRLMKKTGVRQIIVNLMDDIKSGENEENVRQIGAEAVFALLEGITDASCEKELFEFLSGPFEKTVEEVAELELLELVSGLQKLAEENNLEHFFTSAFGTIITG